ncbi:MAG TPA: ATP-binding protein [Phycisphaerales bacterium]|nr:ATP-binding protein [Phycisphaerales bacterium]
MSNRPKVNILLVDDQPAKLLSLETILAELDENLIRADSAEEALRLLLAHDIAIVLVDVCMPRMDGFELAELIRGHPRFNRTAIIFISAVHLTDADRLKGYDLGAVDYIPVPIIPEVLRAKVAIFADLHRKSEELKRLNQELERRVADRTRDLEESHARLRESEHRFQQIAHAIDEVFWLAEVRPSPTMLYVSPAWERIWRRNCAAALGGPDAWLSAVHPDDRATLGEHLAGLASRDAGSAWELEYRIVRPDGEVRWIRERARIMDAAPGPDGEAAAQPAVLHAAGLSEDVTERRAAAAERDRLLAILEATPDFIATADVHQRTSYLNPAARRMLGIAADATPANFPLSSLFPPDVPALLTGSLPRDKNAAVWEGESTLRTSDGKTVPVSQVVIAHRDPSGNVDVLSTVARDITERKRAEEILSRDRETLERLVEERTEALARSNERLRLADRMAMIGTLSAGLGHDMGNLLLPVRMRLDSIEAAELPPSAREDIAAIRKASDYLQRLARSLRLLSIDPYTEEVDTAETDPAEWWSEAEGMLRNGVTRPTVLTGVVDAGLPPMRIGKAALTQIAFNLVQNAGDALRARSDGQVRVRLSLCGDKPDCVSLTVIDNGPGMDEATLRRCTEPFFTTKTRGLSTGLGLTLVSGLVQRIGGKVEVKSVVGAGTTFAIAIPVAKVAARIQGAPTLAERSARCAVICVKDPRLCAHLESTFRSLGFDVARCADAAPPADADVWVIDENGDGTATAAETFAAAAPGRRVLIVTKGVGAGPRAGAVSYIEPKLKPSELRASIRAALTTGRLLQEAPA